MMILSHNKEINQDNNKWSFEEIAEKHLEESNELARALIEKDTMHIAEEVFDQLQICIDVLDKLESLGINIEQMCMRHNKKLVMRRWVDKGFVKIEWQKRL
ncbi:NTP pyrophosphatase (non-canonical NTP hydrolase) [Clostridium beijerinckii]|nr:NTP pyrophosphatase (non-canonical NTP hydrolase) [Clostridium beijerinckii]